MGNNKLRIIIISSIVLAILVIGGLSIYTYAGAGALFNQKHSHTAQLSAKLSPPHSLVAAAVAPPTSKTVNTSTSTKQTNSSATANAAGASSSQNSSSVSSADSAATYVAVNTVEDSCTVSNNQSQITSLQTQITSLTQQKEQLRGGVGGLLDTLLSATTQQKIAALESQISSLQNKIQLLSTTTTDCQSAS
jgi:hypothetical protein